MKCINKQKQRHKSPGGVEKDLKLERDSSLRPTKTNDDI